MPREYRKQLLGDTSAILWALVTQKPDLTGWQPVHDWLRETSWRSSPEGGRMSERHASQFVRQLPLRPRPPPRRRTGRRRRDSGRGPLLLPVSDPSHDLEATSAVVLRQLSSDTADRGAKTVEESLKRPHISVLLAGAAGEHRTARSWSSSRPATDSSGRARSSTSSTSGGERGQRPRRALAGLRPRQRRAEPAGARPVPRRTEVGDRLLPKFQQMSRCAGRSSRSPTTSRGRQHYIQAQLRFGPRRRAIA